MIFQEYDYIIKQFYKIKINYNNFMINFIN